MSAFILSNAHISAILGAYAQHKDNYTTALDNQKIGQLLVDENVKSVNSRYHDASTQKFSLLVVAFHQPISVVAAIKLIHCLEYQSCEHDGWKTSQACQILGEMKEAILRGSNEYDKAQWEFKYVSAPVIQFKSHAHH